MTQFITFLSCKSSPFVNKKKIIPFPFIKLLLKKRLVVSILIRNVRVVNIKKKVKNFLAFNIALLYGFKYILTSTYSHMLNLVQLQQKKNVKFNSFVVNYCTLVYLLVGTYRINNSCGADNLCQPSPHRNTCLFKHTFIFLSFCLCKHAQ